MLQSVATALRAIEYLARARGAGISEMSRELDITTGTAYRLVRTLVNEGFAEQNPQTKQYRLSLKFQLLAAQMRPGEGLRGLAQPFLQRLSEQTDETVNLGALVDREIVYLDKIASRELMSIEIKQGSHVAAHTTALGKAILACSEPEVVQRYLAGAHFEAITPSTIASPEQLRAELVKVAGRGYAIDESELLEDVRCVAAAVVNVAGVPQGAISVTAPRSRFEDKRPRLIEAVLSAAGELSALIAADDQL
jgi:DNA-binding IclR family transcriptional regulator